MLEQNGLKIRPYARLLTMLGDQLIKNERIALIELIKNSYDADSPWVKVSFKGFGADFEVTPKSEIVIEDAGGANAAPEGEFSRITDYTASSQTVTVSPALTAAPAAGDRVLIVPPDFPLYDMIEVVNDALKNIGDIPKVDVSQQTSCPNKSSF